MKHEISTTFEFQPKQIYCEMVYYRPNTMTGIVRNTKLEAARESF